MRFTIFPLLIMISALTLSSCAGLKQNKWLTQHNKNLTQISKSTIKGEEKLDALIADYVSFMKQDLKFINPAKTVKFARKYHDQNDGSFTAILRSVETWQSDMNALEKISFGARLVKKPYFTDMVELVPKFKKKYKEYEFVLKMTNRVTGGVTKMIGK